MPTVGEERCWPRNKCYLIHNLNNLGAGVRSVFPRRKLGFEPSNGTQIAQRAGEGDGDLERLRKGQGAGGRGIFQDPAFLIGTKLHHMVGPSSSHTAEGAVDGALPTTGLEVVTCQTLAVSYRQGTGTAAAFEKAF